MSENDSEDLTPMLSRIRLRAAEQTVAEPATDNEIVGQDEIEQKSSTVDEEQDETVDVVSEEFDNSSEDIDSKFAVDKNQKSILYAIITVSILLLLLVFILALK